MRKNQQGRPQDKKGKGGGGASNTPATHKSSPTNPHMASSVVASELLGFGQAVDAQLPAFVGAAAASSSVAYTAVTPVSHHLTPHQATHLSSSQNLATIGLPSPMGLGATATTTAGSAAALPQLGGHHAISPSPSSSMAFSHVVSQHQAAFLGGAQAASASQLSSTQIEQIAKDLEQRAGQGDLDSVCDLLASHHESIPKKTLNVALRAAVKGCNTALLDQSIQCCEQLIDAGANINSEEASEGKTALMMACEKGYLELVSNLLDHEALIGQKDQKKRTPLMYAIGAKAQNFDVVRELLNRHAEVNERTLTGLTPLLQATRKEHTRIVRLLLKSGAEITAQFPDDLNSSLHYAVLQGNLSILKVLLEHCAISLADESTQEFLYLLNRDSKTALSLAQELSQQDSSNETRASIYSELNSVHSAKEKAIEDVVQTLLQKEQPQPQQANTVHTTTGQLPTQTSGSTNGPDSASLRQLGPGGQAATALGSSSSKRSRQQLKRKQSSPAAEGSRGGAVSGSGVPLVQQQPVAADTAVEVLEADQRTYEKRLPLKLVSRNEAEAESEAAGAATVSDEDDFQSATSKTPQGSDGASPEEAKFQDCTAPSQIRRDSGSQNESPKKPQEETKEPVHEPVVKSMPLTRAQRKQLKAQKQQLMLQLTQSTGQTQPKKSQVQIQATSPSTQAKQQATQPFNATNATQQVTPQTSIQASQQQVPTQKKSSSQAKAPVQESLDPCPAPKAAKTKKGANTEPAKPPSKGNSGRKLSEKSDTVVVQQKEAEDLEQRSKEGMAQLVEFMRQQSIENQKSAAAKQVHAKKVDKKSQHYQRQADEAQKYQEEDESDETTLRRAPSTNSHGAVQQPILKQQSQPQSPQLESGRRTQVPVATHPDTSLQNKTLSSTYHKQQNAAVVGQVIQIQSDMDPNSASDPQQQDQANGKNAAASTNSTNALSNRAPFNPSGPSQLPDFPFANSAADNHAGDCTAASLVPKQGGFPPQQQLPPMFQGGGNGGGAANPVQVPIQLFKNLDTKKAQLDFILEQQEMKNKMLSYQLFKHKERVSEVESSLKQARQDHIIRVNEYYNQANSYYENFRQLQTEMSAISEQNESKISQSFDLISQLRQKVKGTESARGLVEQIEGKLREIQSVNQKYNDESDFRKEDEKSFINKQQHDEQARVQQESELKHMAQEMAEMDFVGATKQRVARMQTQYSNLLVDMENAYGEEGSEYQRFDAPPRFSTYPQQVFNKLHDEIILFEESVKSIMAEMDPIKTIIIDKISSFIKQVIPNGDVEIYGSHATKLCLHWSDIDLVLKPVASRGDSNSAAAQGRGAFGDQNSRSEASSLNTNAMGFNMPNTRNWLSILSQELRVLKNDNKGWIQKVDFIENTTVPVIKLVCSFYNLQQNSSGLLLLPDGGTPRYPHIVAKPINVDITLWSETHNGLPCVQLVKSYLSESQLIEPLILVLKQMLKVWGFNDAYTGGLSSYALFLMIVSFLQEKQKPPLKSDVNMGETLIEFLRYYAHLDFSQYAICCKKPGEQSDKQNLYLNNNSEFNLFMPPKVVIDDPLMASNNVGKSAFRFQEIKNLMCHAYNSVFTGCFCSCHFKSLCRNTTFHQNANQFHQSQLLNMNQSLLLPTAPQSYLSYQHPPYHYTMLNGSTAASIPSTQQQQSSMGPNSSAFRPPGVQAEPTQDTAEASASNQAPFPASASAQQQQPANRPPPPSLRTQSQPFVIGNRTSSQMSGGAADQQEPFSSQAAVAGVPELQYSQSTGAAAGNSSHSAEFECSCDSILSRLIYGYSNYRRTIETLEWTPYLFQENNQGHVQPQFRLV